MACVRTKDVPSILNATVSSSLIAGLTSRYRKCHYFLRFCRSWRGWEVHPSRKSLAYKECYYVTNMIWPILVGNNDNEARLFEVASGGQIPEPALAMINLDFSCPSGHAARYRYMNGVKAYRYRYFGDWPNLNTAYGTGVFHSAEVLMIFGNAPVLTGVTEYPQ